MDIKTAMPLLARHEGIWEGWYRYYDQQGVKVDEHRSRLICRFPAGGTHPYHQTNYYTWADGKKEVYDFPAEFRAGRVWFDNERIAGWAAEVALDEHHRTLMLYWQRKAVPDTYLYEMIQLSDCGLKRQRALQWIREGDCVMRTLIDEQKVADNWRGQ